MTAISMLFTMVKSIDMHPAAENGAHGQSRTDTGDALNVVPLLLGYVSGRWSLQPVLPRRDFFTGEICSLLHGGAL